MTRQFSLAAASVYPRPNPLVPCLVENCESYVRFLTEDFFHTD